jgi:hypothetical protein
VIFIETPTFAADREHYLPDDVFADFQQDLADRPDAGDLIPGGRGLRKIRVAESQILLVVIFAKNVRVDLTRAQLKALATAYTEG